MSIHTSHHHTSTHISNSQLPTNQQYSDAFLSILTHAISAKVSRKEMTQKPPQLHRRKQRLKNHTSDNDEPPLPTVIDTIQQHLLRIREIDPSLANSLKTIANQEIQKF